MAVEYPLDTLSAELHNIISDPQLVSIAKVLHFNSVDQVVAWIGPQKTCPPRIPIKLFEQLKQLHHKHQETCIISGHDTWYRWRPLLADIFCFFEYYYEDGAGRNSSWRADAESTFSHTRNQRIFPEDRNNYSTRIALHDTKQISRIEVLRALSIPQKFSDKDGFLSGGKAMLTCSQMNFAAIDILNKTLRAESGNLSLDATEVGYRPMETGELVIRFFGMKDGDNIIRSYNILPVEIIEEAMTEAIIEKNLRILALKKIYKNKSKMRVHMGFWKQYLDIQLACLQKYKMDLEEYLVTEYYKLQEKAENPSQCRIVFTGHSMGGALASICVYRIFKRYPNDLQLRRNIYVIAFGSPKFSRRHFAKWIETNLPNNYLNLSIEGDHIVSYPPAVPGWISPGRYRVELTSKYLEQALKEARGEDFEWEPYHFRYWKLMRQAVARLQPCPPAQRELQNLFWQYLESMEYEKISENMKAFAPLLNITRDRFGQYPLHHVCCLGSERLSSLFLYYEADPNLVDFDQWTPLHRAYRGGHFSIAKLLIEHQANVRAVTEGLYTPLHYAARVRTPDFSSQIASVQRLLDEGADINAETAEKDTPLLIAIRANATPEFIRFLITSGASLNVKQRRTRRNSSVVCTPLVAAIKANYSPEVIKFLLDNNANVHQRTVEGTPIEVAAAGNRTDILPLLNTASKFLNRTEESVE